MAKPPAVAESRVRVQRDSWHTLRRFTSARIGLGRAGGSIPTRELLEFQLAHAQARDAVHRSLDIGAFSETLRARQIDSLALASAAGDRHTFIHRPDLGRILDEKSKRLLQAGAGAQSWDVVFVIADGLSALAVERHALPVIEMTRAHLTREGLRIAPYCLVSQGRVAIGDEIGALLPAQLSVVLIGERPGLSSPDSLGAYLTWNPLPGRSNAERNCVSNIRPEGLNYAAAAFKLLHLMRQARARKLSGIALKEDAALPAPVELLKLFPEADNT
ncbi:MAG: ethanolamine ammonia-lyase subunit EutC [Burkholderiales bacterium]|nr:ethanolamine ammonia-lyase subunit EutC [Burkholderiales bacterium]